MFNDSLSKEKKSSDFKKVFNQKKKQNVKSMIWNQWK